MDMKAVRIMSRSTRPCAHARWQEEQAEQHANDLQESCGSMFCTLLFISEPDGIGLSTWIWSASLVVCMPWRGVHSGGELASLWVQTVISFVEFTKIVKATRGHYMTYIIEA
jgi:hypothetical protein